MGDNMTLIIHDLDNDTFLKTNFSKTDNSIVVNLDNIKPCIGCFKCWLETPNLCALNDEFKTNGNMLDKADKIIVISKNTYGMYSPKIKNFFDRSISYVMPQFKIIYGEMHHYSRYKKKLNIDYYIYGNILEEEKDTLLRLVKANSENMHSNNNIYFIDKLEDIYE